VNAGAVAGAASVDLPNRVITAFTPDGGAARPSLQLPVTASGNVLSATRGESVLGEVLGSGDASQRDQSFVLQKKPLTYLPDPNGPDLVSSLKIWVNGVAWREAPTLYNVAPGTPVYMVRTDIDGAATITFPLLPTGAGNVVANYRFGAGAAAPPAGAVRQIARPVPGVLSVSNPLAAYGGQDAEAPNRIRRYGPRTALRLGRAVSLVDMEAIAAGTPGVRAARATWTWSRTMQRPLAYIAYVGDPALAAQIYQSLTGSMDPATPVEVVEATVVTVVLSMQVSIEPDYIAADVLAALRAMFCADLDGTLVAENVGIGQPLYRSRILAAAVAVAGVTSVTALNWNAAPFDDYAETPGEDGAFDFIDTGDVVLNGGGLHG
jgi:predicted phage baseplate assembly protein